MESVSLLSTKEPDSFSTQRRGCRSSISSEDDAKMAVQISSAITKALLQWRQQNVNKQVIHCFYTLYNFICSYSPINIKTNGKQFIFFLLLFQIHFIRVCQRGQMFVCLHLHRIFYLDRKLSTFQIFMKGANLQTVVSTFLFSSPEYGKLMVSLLDGIALCLNDFFNHLSWTPWPI